MEDKSFLGSYIMISNIRTILFILILIGAFFIIKKLEKKKVKFTTRTIYGMLIGLALGLIIQCFAGFPEDPEKVVWLKEISNWYGFIGSVFMDLLKMLVVPMVFVSILKVIINMNEEDNIKSLTLRTIGMLMATTAISSVVGIIVANMFHLGKNMSAGNLESKIREVVPLTDTLEGMLPSNIIETMAKGNVVGVIIFAVFLGLAVRRMKKKYAEVIKPFEDLVEAFYKIILSVAMTIIKFMPYAVIAMLADTLVSRGLTSMIAVMHFVVGLYIAVIIVFAIHLLILTLNGLNPIQYIKNASEALILAFTSRSSLGTLPVTIETLKNKQGVDEGVASFAASLAANMGMNGCAGVYPAMMAVTLGNMAGIDLNIGFYVMLIVVIVVTSLGIAGLPGTATMAVSVTLSGVGLGSYFPLASGIIAIDPILDMGRTCLNVNGANVSSVVVAKSLKKFDKNIYNK